MSETICEKCGKPSDQCTCGNPLTVTVKVQEDAEFAAFKKELRDTLSEKYGVETSEKSTFGELRAKIELAQKDKELKESEAQKNARKGTTSGAAGKAPLSSEEKHGDLFGVKSYETVQEMMEDVENRCNSENPDVAQEAKIIKGLLEEKLHSKSFQVEFEQGFNINEFWEKEKQKRERKERGEQA